MMSSFKLHSDDSEFNNRVDALFSSLQTAAVDLEPQVQKRTYEESSKGDDDGDDSFCRIGGERSQKFKRPEGIPPKWRGGGRGGGRGYLGGGNRNLGPRNSTPDYVKNPQNWTRYNMKDTKVLSDRENKLVGLQLFDELRSRRQKEEDSGTPEDDSEMSECHKVIFKKPVKPDEKDSEDVNKDKTTTNADEMFGGPKKFRMEEYKVGQAKPKFKNKTKPVTVDDDDDDEDSTEVKKKADSVKLSYLTYEEEEENDD